MSIKLMSSSFGHVGNLPSHLIPTPTYPIKFISMAQSNDATHSGFKMWLFSLMAGNYGVVFGEISNQPSTKEG